MPTPPPPPPLVLSLRSLYTATTASQLTTARLTPTLQQEFLNQPGTVILAAESIWDRIMK